MKLKPKKIAIGLGVAAGAALLTGCASNADAVEVAPVIETIEVIEDVVVEADYVADEVIEAEEIVEPGPFLTVLELSELIYRSADDEIEGIGGGYYIPVWNGFSARSSRYDFETITEWVCRVRQLDLIGGEQFRGMEHSYRSAITRTITANQGDYVFNACLNIDGDLLWTGPISAFQWERAFINPNSGN